MLRWAAIKILLTYPEKLAFFIWGKGTAKSDDDGEKEKNEVQSQH